MANDDAQSDDDPEAGWTPQMVAGWLADEINCEEEAPSPKIRALKAEIYGLLRGMQRGRIQTGKRILRDSIFEIISLLGEEHQEYANRFQLIISRSASYGLTLDGQELVPAKHHGRLR